MKLRVAAPCSGGVFFDLPHQAKDAVQKSRVLEWPPSTTILKTLYDPAGKRQIRGPGCAQGALRMNNQRREVWYKGHVQGVGFRYTVSRIAGHFDVTGFVRNSPDGRVQLVCEGPRDELEDFLDGINDRMRDFIRDTQEDTRPATGEFGTFEIRT